jgi:hypothetical protein
LERFEQRVSAADIAAELRVTERSVWRWRQAWLAGGLPGLASKGQGARCRLDEAQLAELEIALEAGPLPAAYRQLPGRSPCWSGITFPSVCARSCVPSPPPSARIRFQYEAGMAIGQMK